MSDHVCSSAWIAIIKKRLTFGVPGRNQLSDNFRAVNTEDIFYFKFKSRELNLVGQWVVEYHCPVNVQASIQSVNRSVYQQLNLDLKRQYVKVYLCVDSKGIERNRAGDQFIFDGKKYQIDDEGDWFLRDGWSSFMAIEVIDA